jgi:membrane protein DedA with SNARE-associated domain
LSHRPRATRWEYMDEWLLRNFETLAQQAGWLWCYVSVCGVLIVSGLGLPIPEDIPLLVGGMLCGRGYANIFVMLPLTFFAVIISDLMVFTIGRVYGHHVPRLPIVRRYLTPARLARAEQAFHHHGGKTLFIARFLPGARSAIFFTAGTFKIPAWKMLAFDGSAALLSVPTLVLVGYFGAAYFEQVVEFVERTQIGLGILAALVVVGFVFWRMRRRRLVAPPPAGM